VNFHSVDYAEVGSGAHWIQKCEGPIPAKTSPFIDRADGDALIFIEVVDIRGNWEAIVHRGRPYMPLKRGDFLKVIGADVEQMLDLLEV
jgi:hypothetical protein